MWAQIIGLLFAAFFVWAVIYGLIFNNKGPTYAFLAKMFRR